LANPIQRIRGLSLAHTWRYLPLGQQLPREFGQQWFWIENNVLARIDQVLKKIGILFGSFGAMNMKPNDIPQDGNQNRRGFLKTGAASIAAGLSPGAIASGLVQVVSVQPENGQRLAGYADKPGADRIRLHLGDSRY
jgi:hypothetical protein